MNTYNTNGRASAQSGESVVIPSLVVRSPRMASLTLSGAALSGLMLLAPAALAAETSSDTLETVQVTANRIPQLQNDVLASTEVITRDEINRLQASSLVDLLQSRNGIEIVRNGPLGGTTSIFMRGTNSDHSLILVNGQRIAGDGTTYLQLLPLSGIERVEIVRGPRASVYGSDAIGGVINLITRRGSEEGQHAEISLRAGSNGTFKQNAQFSSIEDDTRLSANIHHDESDGYSAQSDNNEDDGYEATGAELQLGHDFGKRATLEVGISNTETDFDYDSCYPAPSYSETDDCEGSGQQTVINGSLLTHLNPDWDMTVTAAHTRISYDLDTIDYEIASNRNEAGLRHDFFTDIGTVSLGADYREESIDVDTYAEDSRYVLGYYAQWQARVDRHQLSAAIRRDDDNRFGDETTGSASYGFSLTDDQQIGVSYATAFKAPDLIDLYYPGYSNPDLDAETSATTELFWRLDKQRWNVGINVFQTDIDDLIAYDSTYTPYNVDEARIRGLELSSGWQGDALSVKASATWQDPIDKSDGSQLVRRAKRFARLDVDYAVNDWNFGTTLRGSSERYDSDGTRLGGYALVGLRSSWQVMPSVQLSAKLDNLFDRDYELANGYDVEGRYVEGGVTFFF